MDQTAAIPADELNRMTDDIIAAMKTVFDPEIPVDIYELGLIYKVDIDDARFVNIDHDTPLLLPPDIRQWVPADRALHL